MIERTQPVKTSPHDDLDRTHEHSVPRRLRLAEAFACLSLLAAFVAAIGPAERVRTEFSWPRKAVPSLAESNVWYAPLLLSARIPESVSARLSCTRSATLSDESTPATIFATVRRPDSTSGLVVTQRGPRLEFNVGDRLLASARLAAAPRDPSCAYALRIEDGKWSLAGGPREIALAGDLAFMPEVNGLFSEVDLRTEDALLVEVTTQPHKTEAATRQTIARIIAAIGAVLALTLVAVGQGSLGTRGSRGRPSLRAIRAIRSVDVAVVLALVGWWLLAPAHWDDGWVAARQSNFVSAGGFSNYYDSLGSNLPNGYWLEWLQHWLSQSSNAVLVLRIPALLSLVAAWAVTRWALSLILKHSSRSRVLDWALASTFVVGALAWGMTLRPEPFTAFFVTLAFACAAVFALSESSVALALAIGLIPLAATGHHAGLLTAAPLLAIGPQLISWVRRNPAAATALVTAAFALLLLLAFLGADVGQRSLEAQALRSYGVPDAWFDEFRRYGRLSDFHGGPPLRRGAVALIGLVVLAFLVRRTGTARGGLLDLPARTLIVGLILLIAVPSKWPWHFGALIGIAAIAVASETFRIRNDNHRPRGWQARWLLAVAAITVAIAWSWGPRELWTLLDTNTVDWTPERAISLSTVAAALPVLLVFMLAIGLRLRRCPSSDSPWRVASLAAPIVVIPMLVFTVAVLTTDAVRSEWTLARQNAGSLRGDAGCGLADTLLIPRMSSMRPVPAITGRPTAGPGSDWMPPAPVQSLERFQLGPSGLGSVSSPWFNIGTSAQFGFFLAGYQSGGDKLVFEWGRRRRAAIDRLGSRRLAANPHVDAAMVTPWRFVASGELPQIPRRANAVRITLQSNSASASTLAVTSPVTYQTQPLSQVIRTDGVTTLVSPAFRIYMPCAVLPTLGDGLVGAPQYIVSPNSFWIPDPESPVGYRTSPFRGITDLYDVTLVSIADSKRAVPLRVWQVETRVPAATLLTPTQREIVG